MSKMLRHSIQMIFIQSPKRLRNSFGNYHSSSPFDVQEASTRRTSGKHHVTLTLVNLRIDISHCSQRLKAYAALPYLIGTRFSVIIIEEICSLSKYISFESHTMMGACLRWAKHQPRPRSPAPTCKIFVFLAPSTFHTDLAAMHYSPEAVLSKH